MDHHGPRHLANDTDGALRYRVEGRRIRRAESLTNALLTAKVLHLLALLEVRGTASVSVQLSHDAIVAELSLDFSDDGAKMIEELGLAVHQLHDQPYAATVVINENIEINERAPSSRMAERFAHV